MKILKTDPVDDYKFYDAHLNFIDKLFIKFKHKRPKFNQRMLDEDFANLFSATVRQSGDLFNVETNNAELMQRLLSSFDARYTSRNIDNKICRLVKGISKSLISSGKAMYYVHYSSDKSDFSIAPFHGEGYFSFFNVYFQWVPKRYDKYRAKHYPRELRIINKRKMIQFTMQTSIKNMLLKQNRILNVLDKYELDGRQFYHEVTYENPYQKNDFDFSVWRDIKEDVLYRSTRETGWNGRKYDSSKRSDFFICHRLIRFRINQLVLRDHILLQLSSELTKLGRQYDTAFIISILPTNILPKIAELKDLEIRLSKEEVSFTEVLDYCYGH